MRFWRFKVGFVAGYLVATIRHSKDADPLIQRAHRLEEMARGAREWWDGLGDDHPVRKMVAQGRYAN